MGIGWEGDKGPPIHLARGPRTLNPALHVECGRGREPVSYGRPYKLEPADVMFYSHAEKFAVFVPELILRTI